LQNYDELYSGNGYQRLLLHQIPIVNVLSVRYGPYAVLRIFNNAYSTNRPASGAASARREPHNSHDTKCNASARSSRRVANGIHALLT
jgi:hypothetical protein